MLLHQILKESNGYTSDPLKVSTDHLKALSLNVKICPGREAGTHFMTANISQNTLVNYTKRYTIPKILTQNSTADIPDQLFRVY